MESCLYTSVGQSVSLQNKIHHDEIHSSEHLNENCIAKLSLASTSALAEAELVIVLQISTTHSPPSKVLSRPGMTLTSKAKLLVSMVRPLKQIQTLPY